MAEEQKDSETKERLLACAKKEFVEKGYAKASLRAICREAGVTTGALYFFFQDKDDLFCSLVSHVLIRVRNLLRLIVRRKRMKRQNRLSPADMMIRVRSN